MQSQIPHFFVATLGDAQRINARTPHGITTINELLIRRARDTPDAVAVGMAIPPQGGSEDDGRWGSIVYTYSQLLKSTTAAAHRLSALLPPAKKIPGSNDGPTVAILSESSWDMLMCFFGLIRMGYTVLLIAPQCDARAIQHLVKSTSSKLLLHSPPLAELAFSAAPWCKYSALPAYENEDAHFSHDWWPTPSFVDSSTVAYIHHTSGTTGLPSPIPQKHATATVHLPCLPPRTAISMLTMTPLYHAGVADMMRSMMSSSMIWLFPPTVPITSGNILRAIDTADLRLPESPVNLFTAVPYIQKMCLEDPACLAALQEMDMVGYGGAQLPDHVGDALVENGVNLVSRFGSTECGFLMSSYRDFENDKEWEYLRVSADSKNLVFELREDGARELVVKPGWPHMAKTNRPDGSFATSDLFRPHRTIPRLYKYLTRSDSTLVLLNGKKFDPTQIEDGLRRLDIVEEAIVFGQNKESPGVLIFPARPHVDVNSLMHSLEGINSMVPAYARIPPELVVDIEYGREWPRSSKGLALRNQAEEVFRKEIEDARKRYEGGDVGGDVGDTNQNPTKLDVGELEWVVAQVVEAVVGRKLGNDEDFFMSGVDSIMATRIRRLLMNKLKKPLPTNVVFEQRTIKGLVYFISTAAEVDMEKKHELHVMQEMLNKFAAEPKPPVVLLTGATGALGAHILHVLVQLQIPKIICLCRASSSTVAKDRLFASLYQRKIPIAWSRDTDVRVSNAILSEPMLGLQEDVYTELASEVTVIIHAAWPVNFLAPLPSFDSALAGTKNLLQLANTGGTKKRMVFCSSTASVIRAPAPIREEPSYDPSHASPLGYSRSKWVAEGLVSRGGGEVVRLGQLSGDTQAGVWNPEEGWPLLLKTLDLVHCLPELREQVQWLPIDIAADAVVRIALRQGVYEEKRFWHVLNNRPLPWSTVLRAMEFWRGQVTKATPQEWVRRLEVSEKNGETVKLLGLWKDTYGAVNGGKAAAVVKEPVFEVKNMGSLFPGFVNGVEIDQEYIHTVFRALGIEGRLPN